MRLGLSDRNETRAIWDYAFELELQVTIGEIFILALIPSNTGTTTFALSQGHHACLAVGDISKVQE